jgi:hypothetical protein
MPKENDLEGHQDMGGKHGGQAGMPKPEERSSAGAMISDCVAFSRASRSVNGPVIGFLRAAGHRR